MTRVASVHVHERLRRHSLRFFFTYFLNAHARFWSQHPCGQAACVFLTNTLRTIMFFQDVTTLFCKDCV